MKTKKNLIMFSLLLTGMFFATIGSQAQTEVKVEKEAKEIRINIEKDQNGNTVVIDTVITDLGNFNLKEFKEKYGVDLNISEGHIDKHMKSKDCNKVVEIIVEKEAEMIEGEEMEMNVFVTDKGETKIIKKHKGAHVVKFNSKGDSDCEKQIIIKEIGGEDGETIVFINDEIELKEGEDGLKIIDVEEINGEIIIKSKIMILELSAEDEDMEKSGLKNELVVEEQNQLEISDLKFYPNPTTGLVKFGFTTESKAPVSISVFDMAGKRVFSEVVSNFNGQYEKEIDLTSMQKGTYFLKINQNNQTESKKIILK